MQTEQLFLDLRGFPRLPRQAHNLLLAISISLSEVQIQQRRILEGIERLRLPSKYNRLVDKSSIERQNEEEFVFEKLLADIHLYLVAWANTGKSLRKLNEILKDPKINYIYKRRDRWFKMMTDARNHFEHIEERVVSSKKIASPLSEIHLISDGKKISVFKINIPLEESFNRVIIIKRDIEKWYTKLPSILDA